MPLDAKNLLNADQQQQSASYPTVNAINTFLLKTRYYWVL